MSKNDLTFEAPQKVSKLKTTLEVLRRELKARLFTQAYLWSTVAFISVAIIAPFLYSNDDNGVKTVAIPPESAVLVAGMGTAQEATIKFETVDTLQAAETKVRDEEADALIAPAETYGGNGGWFIVEKDSVTPDLKERIEATLFGSVFTNALVDAGVNRDEVSSILMETSFSPYMLESKSNTMNALVGSAFGLVTVLIVMIWGAVMSTDVVQEKTTRVVEILVSTIRPWQLLTGKIISITLVGLLQMALVLIASYITYRFAYEQFSLDFVDGATWVTGIISILLGVPTLTSLMAAMASRVDNQEDVATATQPVYLLFMAPFAAVFYLGLFTPDSLLLDISTMIPFIGIFSMPVRAALEGVAVVEIIAFTVISLLTLVVSLVFAGRVYSRSILHSGATLNIFKAFQSQ